MTERTSQSRPKLDGHDVNRTHLDELIGSDEVMIKLEKRAQRHEKRAQELREAMSQRAMFLGGIIEHPSYPRTTEVAAVDEWDAAAPVADTQLGWNGIYAPSTNHLDN